MIDLFIFDHSGVISDDRKPVYEANMMLLKDYGKDRISFDEWLSLSSSSPYGFLRNFRIEINDEIEVFERYTKYFNEIKEQKPPFMYEGVPHVLRELERRGKELAVLSSHPFENLERELSEYGIYGYFSKITGSVTDKTVGLLDICGELEVGPDKSLYTGDTIYDIKAAKMAGVRSAGVCGGYHSKSRLEAENPDYGVFDDLSGLLEIE